EGLVPVAGAARRDERRGEAPETLAPGGGLPAADGEDTREDTRDVRVDRRDGGGEGEARDRPGGLAADPGETAEVVAALRQATSRRRHDLPRPGLEGPSAGVAAAPLPPLTHRAAPGR